MSFGSRVKYARENKKLTQKELADLLGLKVSTISLYETERRQPNFAILENISCILDVSTDWLLGCENNDKQTVDLDVLVNLVSIEKEWPEVIAALQYSKRRVTPEEKHKIALIIKVMLSDYDDTKQGG